MTVHVTPSPGWTTLRLRSDATSPSAKSTLDERLEARLLQTQRLEVLGRIAGGIAHDFNNLLTVIKSYCGFVEAELPTGSGARTDMNEVMQAANSAASLTRQLLTFGCRQALQPQRLDVSATITRILGMLRRVIGEDIRVETDFAPTACVVLADSGQLEQVLMNLTVNARDAMPHGGVLRLRTAAVAIEARSPRTEETLAPGMYVAIVVEDSGVGISPEAVGKIFEAFYTTKEEGAGLGLATVLSIVAKLEGDVRVESTLGQGSRFTVLLPCVETLGDAASVEDVSEKVPTTQPRRGMESILIVEDDSGVRAVLRRMLERLGYTVRDVMNGSEAFDLVAALPKPPDLVLTDVVMPGRNGQGVAERLLSRWPGLRILFMSGYADEELRRRGIVIPSETLLEKPITAELLGHAVRRALDDLGP